MHGAKVPLQFPLFFPLLTLAFRSFLFIQAGVLKAACPSTTLKISYTGLGVFEAPLSGCDGGQGAWWLRCCHGVKRFSFLSEGAARGGGLRKGALTSW